MGWIIGGVAASLNDLAAWEVEDAQEMGRFHQLEFQVNASPALPVQRPGKQALFRIGLFPEWLDRRPEHHRVEPTRNGQHAVPDHLGLGPSGRKMRQGLVQGIALFRGLVLRAIRLKSPAHDQFAGQTLQRPPLRHESSSQVVEKFRVGR